MVKRNTPLNDGIKVLEKDANAVMTTLFNDCVGLFKDAEKAVMEIPNGLKKFKD